MRKTEWNLKGHTFTLCLNAAALTDIYDRFGTEKEIPDLYRGSDKASFDALCWLLWKLSEQGELVRRWEGLDRRPIVPESYFRANMAPFDALDARRALSAAYEQAFRRERDEDDEEEEECYATTCPECEEEIFFDDTMLEDGEIICPNCGAKLEFDLSDLADAADEDKDEE